MLSEEPLSIIPTMIVLAGLVVASLGEYSFEAVWPALVLVLGQVWLQLPWMTYGVIKRWRRHRAGKARERVRQAIDDVRGRVDQALLREAVVTKVRPKDRDLVRTVVDAYLVDEAEELVAVENVILRPRAM